MDLPWSSIGLSSLAGSLILVHNAPHYSVSASYIKTFLALETVQVLLGLLWQVILYPYLFSPIRHLPQPKVGPNLPPAVLSAKTLLQGNSFFNGQFKRIRVEPTAQPHREWIETIPNEGLIYYRTLLNQGRLFITSPQALSEVLTTVRQLPEPFSSSDTAFGVIRYAAGAKTFSLAMSPISQVSLYSWEC